MSLMDDGWEIVRILGTEEEAALLAGFLRSSGVPAEVESLLFHQEPVSFGQLGQVRLLVPGDRADDARRLLEEADLAGAGADAVDGTEA